MIAEVRVTQVNLLFDDIQSSLCSIQAKRRMEKNKGKNYHHRRSDRGDDMREVFSGNDLSHLVCSSCVFAASTLVITGELIGESNYWGASFLGCILLVVNCCTTLHSYRLISQEQKMRLRANVSSKKRTQSKSTKARHRSSPSPENIDNLRGEAVGSRNIKRARKRRSRVVRDSSLVKRREQQTLRMNRRRRNSDHAQKDKREIDLPYKCISSSSSISSSGRVAERISKRRPRLREYLLRRYLGFSNNSP